MNFQVNVKCVEEFDDQDDCDQQDAEIQAVNIINLYLKYNI